ncbi:protein Wiz isoform X2 [Eucyclogobius newberryi]|uniref:protein Wiz isoform X2 n=1 Tax=Eucyclogobius newberryi TaxID=166745 RepID=UPI003B58EB71
MEPEGRPPTPGTSYGPLDLQAQSPLPTSSAVDHNSTLQLSRSPDKQDDPAKFEQSEGAEAGGGAQRRARSSAFPSSLSWDSDSEKETLDEEELTHLSNPHGLASHSPGSPSTGLRLECEDSQEAEQVRPVSSQEEEQEEEQEEGTRSTNTPEPKTSQPGANQSADSTLWNVSEPSEPLVSKSPPKESCQSEQEAHNTEGSHTHTGKEFKERGRDVYTFPGDSDPESPPPAPWARCTFIQRCRRKRVLLRPFSGVAPDLGRNVKDGESEKMYDFEELSEEPKEQVEESASEGDNHIFTCVECSIYFNKQIHLQEHMVEHAQSPVEGGEKEKTSESSEFQCDECGWSLSNETELEGHRRQHQESRDKILKEIEKLNVDDFKKHDDDGDEALAVHCPVRIANTDAAIVDLDAPDVKTPVQARGQTGYRRRFICPVCNFSTRTPQALANHKKTHNRKPTSTQLACLYCAFRTTSKKGLRDHLRLTHQGHGENGQNSKHILKPDISMTGKFHRGVGALVDCTITDGITGNVRLNSRDNAWTKVASFNPRSEYDKLSDSEDEGRVQTTESISQHEGKTTKRTRSLSNTDDSVAQCSSMRTLPLRRSMRREDKPEVQHDGSVLYLRRSSRVSAAPVLVPSDDDEECEQESVRRLLSEVLLDEDAEEIDEDTEELKSVERKCPYCPDRFHNGIGLANHVRGHLNRVGVSYNVRHFISPEEVNAIEKRFSYQKKKKKVANFDPGTFSVMHCEFCNAGFDTRAGLSSHARAHLRDLGITNWDITISPIHVLREVFSSRPDLVIPTAPPRSLCDNEEEEEEDSEDDDDIMEVKLEEESRSEISESAVPWKYEDQIKECKDEEEEVAVEERDALQLEALSLVQESDRSPQEDVRAKDDYLKCEVCGAQFETRRGLSSHARSHLRQLGIRASESSGAPIHFLYQIAKERNLDSQIRRLQEPTPAKNCSPSTPRDPSDEVIEVMDVEKTPVPPSLLAKAAKAVPCSPPSPVASPLLAPSPSSVVRKAPISSLLPVSSPLRSLEHKAGGMRSLTASLSMPSASKPVWAPQDTDAPLNLTLEADPHKDIVCQLCGAWFETRKGLSSHARAHLRHFGVEYSESKGSPIDLLTQLIESDEFKHKARELQLDGPVERQGLSRALSSPKPPLFSLPTSASPLLYKVTTSKTTSASHLLGPPAKRLKPSSMQIFRLSSGELMTLPLSEPLKEIGCEFCGEYFENRKGLSSHARSHLRQMGITQWSVNGSPIDTLRELIARRGLPSALPLKPLRNPAPSSPAPPRSPLASTPPSAQLSRLPFAFARRQSPPQMVSKLNSAPQSSLGGLLKPKMEPVQLDVTSPGTVARSVGYSPGSLSPTMTSSNSVHPLNLVMSHDVEPTRDIRCEFCGEYFENRKGLSSHARSHLRQMGITQWSVNGSPIDTLREVMRKRGVTSASSLETEIKKESGAEASSPVGVSTFLTSRLHKSPLSLLQSGLRVHKAGLCSVGTSAVLSGGRFLGMSPLAKHPLSEDGLSSHTAHSPLGHLKNYSPLPHDLSFKRMSPPVKHRPDPSCELCGFYFENRKALASHARAHLRQFGVTEWSVNGSPIETLSAWIRSRPQKVLDMHRSYMQGNSPALKKKCRSPLSVSADSPHVLPASSPKASASSSSSSHWSSSLAVSLVPPINREVAYCPSKTSGDESSSNHDTTPPKPPDISPSPSRLSGSLPLQAQVARSELNVRLPRGFERRPLKHPLCSEGAERASSSPRLPRTGTGTGTVPALVPKPPSYPLVKLEGNFYTLKCRFCEVEFHGPLSVQEDWIRHLQQHIFKMNYKTPPAPKASASTHTDTSVSAPVHTSASTSTSSACTTAPALISSHAPTLPAKCTPHIATELDHISTEPSTVEPTPV